MIETFHSIILGAVQGITEFLPISSSWHLAVVPWTLKWKDFGLTFDVALHFGTAIAIIGFFWKDWIKIIKAAFCHSRFFCHSREGGNLGAGSQIQACLPAGRSGTTGEYPSNFLWQIIVASIPAAIFGALLDNAVENYFRSAIILISINMIIFGIILWAVDKYAKTNETIGHTTYKQSLLVGLSQCLALIPGVSRSGITMLTSRSLGFDREKAARFSFLLSTPITLGAFVLKAKDIGANDLNSVFILGVISSTVFGFLAIKYLLLYLKKGNFSLFAWYRIVVAIIVIGVYLAR